MRLHSWRSNSSAEYIIKMLVGCRGGLELIAKEIKKNKRLSRAFTRVRVSLFAASPTYNEPTNSTLRQAFARPRVKPRLHLDSTSTPPRLHSSPLDSTRLHSTPLDSTRLHLDSTSTPPRLHPQSISVRRSD
jgi:hypothetical protein